MKINKLFHWLYAILMLLPIFAIGFTCAYVTFNKNAYQSYYGETINESKNIFIKDKTKLITGDKYFFNMNDGSQIQNYIFGNGNNSRFYISNVEVITNSLQTTYPNVGNATRMDISKSNTTYNYFGCLLYDSENNLLYNSHSDNASLVINFNLTSYYFNSNDFFTYTNCIYTKEYNRYSFLDNVFYYSLDEMKNNPLFSWANNNFLTNPFSYLFNLFGVPTNSGIMTLLSYWLDISIIWLVFDLIMYVPLLAHRWIDKGMVD